MQSSSAAFTVSHALGLPEILHGQPELLTPSTPLTGAIRWTHVIGTEHPGSMLRGNELVLSTLTRIDEYHANPVAALQEYLGDLDRVGAAAIMLEIFPHRVRLLAALHRLVTEREASGGTLPVFLFQREVGFVRITESVQRELVSRELDQQRGALRLHDPLISSTTNLLDDLSAPGGISHAEAAERAGSLGIPAQVLATEDPLGEGSFTALVFRLDGSAPDPQHRLRVLTAIIRAAGNRLRSPTLIGLHSESELAVLVTQRSPDEFVAAVADEAARRRTQVIVPRYRIGVGSANGRELVHLRAAPDALQTASAVAASAALIEAAVGTTARGDTDAPLPRPLWRVPDLGLRGLLVHLIAAPGTDHPSVDWLIDHYLAVFGGDEGRDLRALVTAHVEVGENKTALAARLGISRPTLYGRIRRLEAATGGPLTGETLSVLHAVLTLDELRGRSSHARSMPQ